MITKLFLLAKEISAIRTKSLRGNKIIRDHDGPGSQGERRAGRHIIIYSDKYDMVG
jgi:hypothetical protein